MNQIELPNDWDCMAHQRPIWNYFDDGGTRAVAVWHRRAGKDSFALNYTSTEAMSTPGVYWHMLPTQKQARKVVWDGIDRKGRRMIDQVFPKELRESTRSQEMQIELKSGSIWQLCGSDNYDSLVGANPKGVVFSEWSLCDPKAWDYIRPILAENGGWALFIYTARGKNHGHTMAEMAKKNPKWFYSCLTVDDTRRDDGSPIITQDAIQDDRDAGMSEDMIQQEYYCSFDVAIPGAYFSKEVARCRKEKRIRFVPVDPMLPIHTFWDLGISDSMSIWFAQGYGDEIRLVNYYENNNEGMAHYIHYVNEFAKNANSQLGYHHAPHDIEVRELTSGKSRKDTAAEMGILFDTVPRSNKKSEDIEAVRRIFHKCFFDEENAGYGFNCLASYHREFDDKRDTYKDKPVHDWASHGSDAFMVLAKAWSDILTGNKDYSPKPITADVGFNVFD